MFRNVVDRMEDLPWMTHLTRECGYEGLRGGDESQRCIAIQIWCLKGMNFIERMKGSRSVL